MPLSFVSEFSIQVNSDEILEGRSHDLAPPMVMTDAASANTVTVCATNMCGCNSHALRRFKAVEALYPQEVGPLLEEYRALFKHDAVTKEAGMTDLERSGISSNAQPPTLPGHVPRGIRAARKPHR